MFELRNLGKDLLRLAKVLLFDTHWEQLDWDKDRICDFPLKGDVEWIRDDKKHSTAGDNLTEEVVHHNSDYLENGDVSTKESCVRSGLAEGERCEQNFASAKVALT
jgi:hypothetical protein